MRVTPSMLAHELGISKENVLLRLRSADMMEVMSRNKEGAPTRYEVDHDEAVKLLREQCKGLLPFRWLNSLAYRYDISMKELREYCKAADLPLTRDATPGRTRHTSPRWQIAKEDYEIVEAMLENDEIPINPAYGRKIKKCQNTAT
jgi:hypothetical protein